MFKFLGKAFALLVLSIFFISSAQARDYKEGLDYEIRATNKTVEKLSDKVQVKLAKAYTGLPAGKSVIDTNAKANIEVLCPKNKMGSVTLRGYNSPQRIMYTLKEKTLYMTTK